MPCKDSSLRMHTLNRVRPSLVTFFFCQVFAMLISFHSIRLSSNPRWNTHPTITATSSIIINILSLLARLPLTHHRLGTPLQCSPPFLVPFFWPWPCYATFPITYLEYLCATNVMEHVLLTFVRWQDASSSNLSGSLGGPASTASLGVPMQLKKGLDSQLPRHAPVHMRTTLIA